MRLNWPDFLTVAESETAGAFYLSAGVRSLLLSLLTSTDEIFQVMELAERDASDALIALAQWELMHETEIVMSGGGSMIPVGGMIPFAGLVLPENFLYCEGQVLSAGEYPELYEAIHPAYKSMIEGLEFITLPDLRDRVVAGASVTYPTGWQHGEGMHTLTINEIPAHTHTVVNAGGNRALVSSGGSTPATTKLQSGSAGGGLAHNNWQPTHHAPWIICVKHDEE